MSKWNSQCSVLGSSEALTVSVGSFERRSGVFWRSRLGDREAIQDGSGCAGVDGLGAGALAMERVFVEGRDFRGAQERDRKDFLPVAELAAGFRGHRTDGPYDRSDPGR